MPSLERLHRALGKEGLAVVSVSVDEDEAVLRRFVEEADQSAFAEVVRRHVNWVNSMARRIVLVVERRRRFGPDEELRAPRRRVPVAPATAGPT